MALTMPRVRHEWRRALPIGAPPKPSGACLGLKLRPPSPTDTQALGALLLDAYRGTIDYEGEDLEASVAVARDFFSGGSNAPDLSSSVVALRGSEPAAVCLVAWWQARACPFVSYIATRPEDKGHGLGRFLLHESLRRLSRGRHAEVLAVITRGNTASEALFRTLGFEDVGPIEPPPDEGPTA
jgi:GNAT superfamily N-acetyltransferase